MKKIIFICTLLALCCQVSIASEQTLQQQITQLKAELRIQNERIKRLEVLCDSTSTKVKHKISADRFAWQNISNWRKVKGGMSRMQVESILGKPTKVKISVIEYVTLFYQGEKSGAEYISGNIELNNNDRVTSINSPVM